VGKFRKKPVEVYAYRWTANSYDETTKIIEWILSNGGTARFIDYDPSMGKYIAIDTLEGIMRAMPGDWIIRGVKDEFYPCKPDIFEATYEEV